MNISELVKQTIRKTISRHYFCFIFKSNLKLWAVHEWSFSCYLVLLVSPPIHEVSSVLNNWWKSHTSLFKSSLFSGQNMNISVIQMRVPHPLGVNLLLNPALRSWLSCDGPCQRFYGRTNVQICHFVGGIREHKPRYFVHIGVFWPSGGPVSVWVCY